MGLLIGTFRRPARALAALVVGLSAVATSAAPATAQTPESVVGSGSTFAKIAIDQWISEVFDRDGLKVEYRGEGSTSGRTNLVENPASFSWASSDISFEINEKEPSYSFDYMPLVAGGTAMMYNLIGNNGQKIQGLRLSPKTVAGIFFGKITTWNDDAIRADNADNSRVNVNNLPPSRITPIYRASGSGTSAVFTGFLAVADRTNWQAMIDASAIIPDNAIFTSTWPTPTEAQQACNAGGPACDALQVFTNAPQLRTADLVVQQVARTQNSIGYAEYAYAEQNNLDSAFVRNVAGRWILPEARNVAVALKRAQRNPDGTQNLADVFTSPEAEAYPISSYNYAIVPTDSSVLSPGEANTLSRFLLWAITQGQATMAAIGYSPLPRPLVQQGLDVIDQLPTGGVDAPNLGVWGCYYELLQVDGSVPDPECERFDPNNPGVPTGGNTAPTTTTTPSTNTTTSTTTPANVTTPRTNTTTTTTASANPSRTTTTQTGSGTNQPTTTQRPGAAPTTTSASGGQSSPTTTRASTPVTTTTAAASRGEESTDASATSVESDDGSVILLTDDGFVLDQDGFFYLDETGQRLTADRLVYDDSGVPMVDGNGLPIFTSAPVAETSDDLTGELAAEEPVLDLDDPFADPVVDPDDPFGNPPPDSGSGGESFAASEFATGRYLNVDGMLQYTNPATQEVIIVSNVDDAGRTNWILVLVALVAAAMLLGPMIINLRRRLTP